MLEFSRKQQEDTIVKEIEDDVKQLTQDEADLEEKLDRLYDLDRMIQEQSFQVTSLKEDRVSHVIHPDLSVCLPVSVCVSVCLS